MHDLEFDHEHEARLDDAVRLAIAHAIWEQETIDLLTVGIDVGSSTTHMLFARVILKRLKDDLSSRFVVVERRVVWRSPISLTPFLPDGNIDADALRAFFRSCYEEAGYAPSDVDTGAVILTGEAIKKRNARAIDEIFASESGKFVCATAGHRLECTLAAHGSGATALSRKRDGRGLHVDIGGGTTKLAFVEKGEIRDVSAFAVGGRLVAQDAAGNWTRIDESAQLVAAELGIPATPEAMADPENRARIARRLATLAVDQIAGVELDAMGERLLLTERLQRPGPPDFITFSGGVAEYIFGYEEGDYGDIARLLAAEIVAQIPGRIATPIVDPGQRIRATVIGASQFTVQVSGKTLYMSDPKVLPVRNVPVVHLGEDIPEEIDPEALAERFRRAIIRQDREPGSLLALAFSWSGLPEYPRLLAVAQAIKAAVAPGGKRKALLALVIDGDVGQGLGRILDRELRLGSDIFAIDGVQLRDLDFVDLGEFLQPPGVVPVVIKSLLFS